MLSLPNILTLSRIVAIPLLAFASATRRIPLSWIGFMQYLTPIMTFLFGAFVMLEPMPLERWIGFICVWASLVLVSLDIAGRQLRRRPPAPRAA